MKRRIAILLLFAFVILSAAGCDAQPVNISDTLDKRVSEEIMAHNDIPKYREGKFQTESHVVLGTEETDDSVTVYAIFFYGDYRYDSDNKAVISSGTSSPLALTFGKSGGSYTLKEYWKPSDGEQYAASIKEKLPANLYDSAMDAQKYTELQKECDDKAAAYPGAK